jgi:ankyrin repeat protein
MGLSDSAVDVTNEFILLCESPENCSIDNLINLSCNSPHVLNACSSNGQLALIAAIECYNMDAIKWILSDPYQNLRINNCNEEDGLCALSAAAACSAEYDIGLFALELIIDRWGAKSLLFNQRDKVNGWGTLHYCAYHNHFNAAKHLIIKEKEYRGLIEPGAASLLDHYGQSCLHVATSRGNADIVQLFLDECFSESDGLAGGQDLRTLDRDRQTAFDVAEDAEDNSITAAEIRDMLIKHEIKMAAKGKC